MCHYGISLDAAGTACDQERPVISSDSSTYLYRSDISTTHIQAKVTAMKLSDILVTKGTAVFTIGRHSTLAEVVSSMVEHNCGSLVVCQDDEVVGIITERDILRACAATERPLAEVRVEERMTHKVVTGSGDDKIGDVMGWMTEQRIRHLPVLERGKLAGIVSIGDIVKAEHGRLSVENHYLKNYIQS